MKRIQELQAKNLIYKIGIDTFGSSIKPEAISSWKQKEIDRMKKEILDGDSYAVAETYHFSNKFQEQRRVKIFQDERHAIDTSIETLALLNLFVYNVAQIEQSGISITGVINVGKYLREKGHNVDYVKLDKWIANLRINKVVSMISSMLIDAFGFSSIEIPYIYKKQKATTDLLCNIILKGSKTGTIDRTYEFIRYSPLGLIALWKHKATSMLDNIEE